MKIKVKVLLVLLAFVTIAASTASAQNSTAPAQNAPTPPPFQLGIKGGFNFTAIGGESFSETVKLGYDLGGYAIFKVNKMIQLQPELMLNFYNTKTSENFGSSGDPNNLLNVSLDYLTIPLLVNITPIKLVSLQVGVQYGVLLNNAGGLSEVQNEENTWAFKLGEFSAIGGVQVNLGNGIKIGARYVAGISNISNLANRGNWSNQGVQLSFGFRVL